MPTGSRSFLATNPVTVLVSAAWKYAGDARGRMVVYAFLSAAALVVLTIEPLVMAQILNALQTAVAHPQPNSTTPILWTLLIYCSLEALFWAFHGPSRVIERRVAFTVRKNLQDDLFSKVTDLPLEWHRDHHSGQVIDRISKATAGLYEFCDNSFEFIQMFVRFVGALVILVAYFPAAGLVLSVLSVLVVISVVYFDRLLITTYERINGGYHHVAEAVHDYITNIKTVITLRLESACRREVTKRVSKVFRPLDSSIVINEVKWGVAALLIRGFSVAVLSWYVVSTIGQGIAIEIGTFFALFEYLRRMGDSFYLLCGRYSSLVEQATRMRAVQVVIAAHAEIGLRAEALPLPPSWKTLQIKRLQFSYDTHTGVTIDVDLSFERRKSYALVGESGSGKSTTLALIRGLYVASVGELLVDGEVFSGGLKGVGNSSTLIPQDPEVFAATVRDNVAMGLATADSAILEAITHARFMKVLDRLPKSLETNVAEKGVNLSGGERQRLALARGLLFAKDSSLVLLDEPTSSVDVFNERRIYGHVLGQVTKSACVISSIHKLYLLPLFDEVLFFQFGRVVGKGKYAELLASCPAFAEFTDIHRNDELVK